jgi:hypothetical protein
MEVKVGACLHMLCPNCFLKMFFDFQTVKKVEKVKSQLVVQKRACDIYQEDCSKLTKVFIHLCHQIQHMISPASRVCQNLNIYIVLVCLTRSFNRQDLASEQQKINSMVTGPTCFQGKK